jgi:hypothetical protein
MAAKVPDPKPAMPTAIRQLSPRLHQTRAPMGYEAKALAIMNDHDLIAVIGFAAIGLLLAISFAIFLPLSDDLAANLAALL